MPRAKHLEFSRKDYSHIPTSDIIGNSSDQSHIYYNIQIYNNSTNYNTNGGTIPTVLSVPADFSQQRAKPFINKPSEYFLTLPYFRLDSNSFPSQIVQPIVNSSYTTVNSKNITLEGIPSIYAIYLQVHDGPNILNEVYQQILWKPLDETLEPPPSPIKVDDIQNEYFWNYSYDYFLDLLNDTLSYGMELMGNENNDNYGKPFFYHDPVSDLIHYVAPLPFVNDISGEDIYTSKYTYKLFVNEPLYQLLQGMVSLYGQSPLTPNIPDTAPFYGYQLLALPNAGNTNVITINSTIGDGGTDIKYIDMPQEHSSVQLWNPVVSIIFLTPNLTVCNEMMAKPVIDGFKPVIYTNNNDSLNILYEYTISKRADPVITQFNTSEYRLGDLFSIQPETQLIIETFWRDTFGILHRFYIEQGSGFNLKILFRKSSFNSKK
jgi:hypothetical protein